MRATLLLLLTTLAFVASLFVVPPRAAHAKEGAAAIGAARLAMVQAAVPNVRKAERTPGPTITPRIFVVEPAAFVEASAKAPPAQWIASSPDRSRLMVFLN